MIAEILISTSEQQRLGVIVDQSFFQKANDPIAIADVSVRQLFTR